MKLWEEKHLSGCYLDLDGHFGNSIEDSREFCRDLEYSVPIGFNINPKGQGEKYLSNLQQHLDKLSIAIKSGQIDYIVACSGADSLIDDDLGGQVDIDQWVKAKQMIYSTIKQTSEDIGKPIPLTISLFAGLS